jgi:hypothetical protein
LEKAKSEAKIDASLFLLTFSADRQLQTELPAKSADPADY